MIKIKTLNVLAGVITFTAIFFTQSVFAQKYKTAEDTVKLNKEYGNITVEIAKLKVNLIKEQDKTSGYQTKSASTAQDAVSSAQDSKETAATATNGNLKDSKAALKQARKANNQANDAQDAKDDQAKNIKKINDINNEIAKKQAILADLDKQKATIMAKTTASNIAVN